MITAGFSEVLARGVGVGAWGDGGGTTGKPASIVAAARGGKGVEAWLWSGGYADAAWRGWSASVPRSGSLRRNAFRS